MRISNIVDEPGRLAAKFEFERRDLGLFTGFIDAPCVVADASAFLLAAWLPAWAFGEKRIAIDGAVCPTLLANLKVAASVFRVWYRDMPVLPVIECDVERRAPSGKRAAFLSGGVDSLAMLRELDVEAAVLVDYQEIAGLDAAETEARFTARKAVCQALCDDRGMELLPVRTNLRRLNASMNFWMKRYHGSFLAAVAHGMDIREISIASTYDAANLEPWGSHPLLDPNYSSGRLTIRHHGLHQSRLDKVRVLADWPLALDRMNVCTAKDSGGRNCGRCEKCLRTRLELMALGLDCKAFERVAVTVDDLADLHIGSNYAWSCYADVLPLVDGDLAALIAARKPKPPGMVANAIQYATDTLRSHFAK